MRQKKEVRYVLRVGKKDDLRVFILTEDLALRSVAIPMNYKTIEVRREK